jgi:hypothetical protein
MAQYGHRPSTYPPFPPLSSPLTPAPTLSPCLTDDSRLFSLTRWPRPLASLFNTEVLALNQDVTPQGRPLRSNLTVWARNLSDGSVGVAFYNENDAAVDVDVSFADLGWPADQTASVRDLWQHADLPNATGKFPAAPLSVEPHATHLFRLTPLPK